MSSIYQQKHSSTVASMFACHPGGYTLDFAVRWNCEKKKMTLAFRFVKPKSGSCPQKNYKIVKVVIMILTTSPN